jgi:hypothetical protein
VKYPPSEKAASPKTSPPEKAPPPWKTASQLRSQHASPPEKAPPQQNPFNRLLAPPPWTGPKIKAVPPYLEPTTKGPPPVLAAEQSHKGPPPVLAAEQPHKGPPPVLAAEQPHKGPPQHFAAASQTSQNLGPTAKRRGASADPWLQHCPSFAGDSTQRGSVPQRGAVPQSFVPSAAPPAGSSNHAARTAQSNLDKFLPEAVFPHIRGCTVRVASAGSERLHCIPGHDAAKAEIVASMRYPKWEQIAEAVPREWVSEGSPGIESIARTCLHTYA